MGIDPRWTEVAAAFAAGDLVVVVGPACPTAAGFPLHESVLAALLDRARKSKPWEESALAELTRFIADHRVPEAFGAAKRLLGHVYGDEIARRMRRAWSTSKPCRRRTP